MPQLNNRNSSKQAGTVWVSSDAEQICTRCSFLRVNLFYIYANQSRDFHPAVLLGKIRETCKEMVVSDIKYRSKTMSPSPVNDKSLCFLNDYQLLTVKIANNF